MSAVALICGAVLAIVALLLAPPAARVVVIVAVALAGLVFARIVGRRRRESSVALPTVRVVAGGALAMAVSAGVGLLAHTAGV